MSSQAHKVVLSGFRFGTILQLAVGPVSLFIFQTAATSGLIAAGSAVLGVTLGDIAYVLAAIWGVGTLIEKNELAKGYIKYFGAVILMIFGVSTVLGAYGISIIPGLNLTSGAKSGSAFINAFFLTVSSPLTIVFWAGVFSAKVAGNGMSKTDVYLFGVGAVISTLFFMTLTALTGGITSSFMPYFVIKALNIIVGILLFCFGIRAALK